MLCIGALVAGPTATDDYSDSQLSLGQSLVGLHHNLPVIGMLGSLLATGVTPGQCAAGKGMYQLMGAYSLP